MAEVTFSAAFHTLPAPSGGKVRLAALVFRAGEYPDKGVTISEADLDAVVARFQGAGRPVPIRAEHRESPLDPLGELVALVRDGAELYGTIQFSEAMAAHLRERGARNLSASFHRDGEGYLLHEVSIVFTGRVEGAGFLTRPADQVAAEVARYRMAGKLSPAMAGPASRLLCVATPISFADGGATVDVAAEVAALLDAIPGRVTPTPGGAVPVGPFGMPGAGGENLSLDPAQRAFLVGLKEGG